MKDLITQALAVEARLRVAARVTHWNGLELEAAGTLASLCTALEAAQKDVELWKQIADGRDRAIQALCVDLEMEQKDAERYRWLRDYSARMKFELKSTIAIAVPNAWMQQDSTESDDDHAIDAVIAAQKRQE